MLDKFKNEQRARVFRNGRSRAIRIPKEFEFEGDEVTIRKEPDGTLTLVPDKRKMSPRELVDWLRAQPPLDEELPEIEDLPPDPFDLSE